MKASLAVRQNKGAGNLDNRRAEQGVNIAGTCGVEGAQREPDSDSQNLRSFSYGRIETSRFEETSHTLGVQMSTWAEYSAGRKLV
jgi:hypothetical protein